MVDKLEKFNEIFVEKQLNMCSYEYNYLRNIFKNYNKKTKSKTKKITKNFIILPKALIFSNQNEKININKNNKNHFIIILRRKLFVLTFLNE